MPISNPIGAAKATTKAIDFQVDLGKTLANPSLEGAKELIKEHPVGSAVTAGAALAAAGLATAGIVSNITNTMAVKENTKATQAGIAAINAAPTSQLPIAAATAAPLPSTAVQTGAAVAPSTPTMPQTEVVRVGGSSTSSKKRKRSSKTANQYFTQKVGIVVQNRNVNTGITINKRYLNKEILLN